MIEVNLLPDEWRPIERTPWPRFAAILATVLIGGIEITFLAGILLNKIPAEKQLRDEEQRQLNSKQTTLNKKRAFVKKIDDYKQRLDTMVELRESQTFWGRMLYHLANRVPENVWISEIRLQNPMGAGFGGAQEGRSLIIKAYARGGLNGAGESASPDMLENVSKFSKSLQADIKGDGFYTSFDGEIEMVKYKTTKLSTAGMGNDIQPADAPKVAGEFELKCKFKKREASKKPGVIPPGTTPPGAAGGGAGGGAGG